MINNKPVRILTPFAIFAAVSWLLWLYGQYFLWIFPLYGFIFIWFSFFYEKELEFLFVFLVTAMGFILPRIMPSADPMGSAVLSFAEVAAIWALFYALHSAQRRRQGAMERVLAGLSENMQKIKSLRSDKNMYEQHRGNILGRIKTQSELADSIQALAACVNVDEIKLKLEHILRKHFPEARSGVETGAPKDFLSSWVAQRKIPLFIKNVAEENRFSAGSFAPEDKSLILVPMHLFGSLAGFIRLASSQPDRFSTGDLRTLELVSTIAAVSMENLYLYDKVKEMAIRDGLTGIFTHRAFQTRLEEEILRSARAKIPFALIMADIDHFKSYNDTYGHQAGDTVLKAAAQTLTENIRDIDFAARYGGEEFALILTGVDRNQAAAVAEHLRKTLEAKRFTFNGVSTNVTASFGVAEFPTEAAISSQLVRAADERLYKAKKSGRNRVVYE